MKHAYFLSAAALTVAAAIPSFAQTSANAPDNSRMNRSEGHRDASADAQGNDSNDLLLTRRIRQSVMADKSLSTYAQNVKIVSVNGKVTLNGVVGSADEKTSVRAKAASVAGEKNVVDKMTIAPPGS